MLNERLARFDFDLTPASARPFVAVPCLLIHAWPLAARVMRRERWNLVLARLQGKEQIWAGFRLEPVPISGGRCARAPICEVGNAGWWLGPLFISGLVVNRPSRGDLLKVQTPSLEVSESSGTRQVSRWRPEQLARNHSPRNCTS